MADVAKRVMRRIGFDNGTFSIEFFCDVQSGEVYLLEINPRHSQSHAELFELVDGLANHDLMVRLGLGQAPRHRAGGGPYGIAGRWYLRRFSGDAVVTRAPTAAEITALQDRLGAVEVSVSPKEGQRFRTWPSRTATPTSSRSSSSRRTASGRWSRSTSAASTNSGSSSRTWPEARPATTAGPTCRGCRRTVSRQRRG